MFKGIHTIRHGCDFVKSIIRFGWRSIFFFFVGAVSLSTVEVSVVTINKESDISVNSVAGATRGRSRHCDGRFLEAWGSFEVGING